MVARKTVPVVWLIWLKLLILGLVLVFTANVSASEEPPHATGSEPIFTASLTAQPATDAPAAATSLSSSPASLSPSASAAVQVNVRVAAVRLLVIDEGGRILEIWSNATQQEWQSAKSTGGGRLVVRKGSADGPEVTPLPNQARDEYEALLRQIDWEQRGLVWTG
ncbi:MAG: hypothetical protein Kow00129_14430 [Thermoleophilia bacterium]